jgi:hypothetical protein
LRYPAFTKSSSDCGSRSLSRAYSSMASRIIFRSVFRVSSRCLWVEHPDSNKQKHAKNVIVTEMGNRTLQRFMGKPFALANPLKFLHRKRAIGCVLESQLEHVETV